MLLLELEKGILLELESGATSRVGEGDTSRVRVRGYFWNWTRDNVGVVR